MVRSLPLSPFLSQNYKVTNMRKWESVHEIQNHVMRCSHGESKKDAHLDVASLWTSPAFGSFARNTGSLPRPSRACARTPLAWMMRAAASDPCDAYNVIRGRKQKSLRFLECSQTHRSRCSQKLQPGKIKLFHSLPV